MRRQIALLALAAALVAAAPAFAQRAPSLADRVGALEQQAANNSGNVDLLNQVQQLRSEVTALRSQLEETQQLNAQMKADYDARWGDLDARLARIETGGGATTVPAAPASASTAPRGATVAAERPPTVRGDAGRVAQSADELPGEIEYPSLGVTREILRFHRANDAVYRGLVPAARIGLVRADSLATSLDSMGFVVRMSTSAKSFYAVHGYACI